MSNSIQIKVEELNALPATKIVENPKVEAKFIQMYNAIWGSKHGEQIYYKEVFNFQKVIRENPSLAECSKMSLFGCFLDMAVNGLSLDPTGRPHCYPIPRNAKIKGADGKDYYEKRASVSITGYGELIMRMRIGQIKYADNPVVVYEGDTFRSELVSGKKTITYSAAIPRQSTRVIGAFIRLVRTDGSEDYQWLLEGDIDRLKHYSEKGNSYWDSNTRQKVTGKANELYTSNGGQIDPGFLENKMIKHAFDAYPKVRVGKFTQLETEQDPDSEVDYGLDMYGVGVEEIKDDKNTPFGEDRQIEEPKPAQVQVTDSDVEEGF